MTQDAKEKLVDWLFQQGVSTVLLCGILCFMGYAVIYVVPTHIDQIDKGYQRNADSLSKSLERIVESHDRDRRLFIDLIQGRQVMTENP